MTLYVVRRLLATIPVLFGVTVITFALSSMLPGDPAREIAGRYATEEQVEAVRERYGFDRPLIVQYGIYLGRLLRADLGLSFTTQQEVAKELQAVRDAVGSGVDVARFFKEAFEEDPEVAAEILEIEGVEDIDTFVNEVWEIAGEDE